jgi:hypothetical protein
MKGPSRSNLFYMRGFAAAWPDPIVQQPVGQLPWGHITVLLDKAETPRTVPGTPQPLLSTAGPGMSAALEWAEPGAAAAQDQ